MITLLVILYLCLMAYSPCDMDENEENMMKLTSQLFLWIFTLEC